MNTADRINANRELWDRWAQLHPDSSFYDTAEFLADPAGHPLDRIASELLGEVSGKRLLHLQCHFGLDTLRMAYLGAEVTGVDFSSRGIATARELAERAALPATFVEADVTNLPALVSEGAFDVVFTSWGTICWFPDLGPWAHGVASRLAPGGVFKMADSHPFLWVFDDECDDPELKVRYSYFMRDALEWEEFGSYAAPGPERTGTSHSWQHTFEEIIGALVGAGLVIEHVHELTLLPWAYVRSMTEVEPGLWALPAGSIEVPLSFTLSARKPL